MLEFKLKANTVQPEPSRIDVTSMTLSAITEDDATRDIISIRCENGDGHQLVTGDIVTFKREEEYIEASKDCSVTVVDKYDFYVEKLPPYELFINGIDEDGYDVIPTSGGTPIHENGIILFFSEPHFFIENKKFSYITQVATDDYYSDDTESVRLCIGDNLLYNGFVYHVNEDSDISDGKYIFGSEPYLNNNTVRLFFRTPDGDEYILNGGIVPITEDAIEDRYRLYIPNTGNEDAIGILSSYASESDIDLSYKSISLEFYAEDNRFYVRSESGNTLEFRRDENGVNTSFLLATTGSHKLTIPIFNNREEGINREDAFSNKLVPEIEENSINKIVDYEKCPFQPVYYDGNDKTDENLKDVNEVVFNLHFRKRMTEDSRQWVTDDTLGWNNYSITRQGSYSKLTPIDGLTDSDADLLTYLDFTDADVYYQRNILKKSFIRTSIYDTSGRTNQALYNYSTMFYDSGKAFSKYLKARALSAKEAYDGITDTDIYYVSDEHIDSKDLRISAGFSAKSKFSSEDSSDGYYLYLFPSVVDGSNVREMYMKVEFNHSKYGRVVPFVLPTNSSGDAVLTTNSSDFPIHYMELSGDNIYSNVDYKKLMKDMYFKILVKYDEYKNRYVWMLPDNSSNVIDRTNGRMVINLFEPRVNGYEVMKSDTEYEAEADYIGQTCRIGIKTIITTGADFREIQRYTLLFNGITMFDNVGISNDSNNYTKESAAFTITGNHACIIIEITNTSLTDNHTAVLRKSGDDTELAFVDIDANATETMEYGFNISDIIDNNELNFEIIWS